LPIIFPSGSAKITGKNPLTIYVRISEAKFACFTAGEMETREKTANFHSCPKYLICYQHK